MSKVIIAGDVNGTGVFTIAAPNGNTNRTLTLPDSAGTILTTATAGVPIGGPAFSAYQSSAQTLSSGTHTKLQFQTEEFDTANAFDSSTNYRFTPNVAGYYQVNGCFAVNVSVTQMQVVVNKNGAQAKSGGNLTGAGQLSGSALIFLNGSTDYVELYGWIASGQALVPTAISTYFQAALVRSAT